MQWESLQRLSLIHISQLDGESEGQDMRNLLQEALYIS